MMPDAQPPRNTVLLAMLVDGFTRSRLSGRSAYDELRHFELVYQVIHLISIFVPDIWVISNAPSRSTSGIRSSRE